ncbi:MAG: hypothetical protein P4L67_02270 [Candidatus Pacebacteria bacterium]|nr:hypothetical protein [Candidatus Paceibacterota bacterium]
MDTKKAKKQQKPKRKETPAAQPDDPMEARSRELLARTTTDPKFMMPGRAVSKVRVDDKRFDAMFHSDKFRISKDSNEISRYYYTTKEQEKAEEEEKSEKSESSEQEEVSSSDYEDGIRDFLSFT